MENRILKQFLKFTREVSYQEHSKKTEESFEMFRPFLQKMRRGFHVSTPRSGPAPIDDVEFDEDISIARAVPNDIAEGYFTVFAVQGEETQRFVVGLDNLSNPAFLNLLEQAREEYGFQQKGALSLPCRPHELQKILGDWKVDHADKILEDWKADHADIERWAT